MAQMALMMTEKDLGRWANRAWLFKSMDFMDYEPRKGFKCSQYFE